MVESKHIVAAGVCLVITTVSSILLALSFAIIDLDEYGLLRADLSGAIVSDETFQTGRHFVGLGYDFVTLKKNQRHIGFRLGEESDAVGVRTIDGKRITIEADLYYVLQEDKIYNIYEEYGLEVDAFIITMVRSRLRNVAARHTATEFFEDRHRVEFAMQEQLRTSLRTRFADVSIFCLGLVHLPGNLEVFLSSTMLKKIKLQEDIQQLEVLRIRANTTVALEEARAGKEKELTILRQSAANRVLVVGLEEANVTATTNLQVGKIEADATRDIAVYDQNTENLRLALVLNTTAVSGRTAVLEQEVLSRTAKLRADTNRQLDKIGAVRDANVERAKDRGTAAAALSRTEVLRTAYANLRDELAFNATHFNTLMWMEAIVDHEGKGVYMDTYSPSDVQTV